VAPRLRYLSSQATQATWSFSADDGARGAELLVDGRPRPACDRMGRQIRCELRGMFPGGHTVELRLPGAVLRRSVLIGRPFPERPLAVRVRTPEEAKAAGEAGADAVVLDPSQLLGEAQEITEQAHLHGARVLVLGQPELVERAGVDGIIGSAALAPELARRFPEARVLPFDAAATARLAELADRGDPAQALTLGAKGLVEAQGLLADALALFAPSGAIVDAKAWPLLRARHRHPALDRGRAEAVVKEPRRLLAVLRRGSDELFLAVNGDKAPWPLRVPGPPAPVDLLGSHVEAGQLELQGGDVALVVNAPAPDRTRF
jgi:hypothetical protein